MKALVRVRSWVALQIDGVVLESGRRVKPDHEIRGITHSSTLKTGSKGWKSISRKTSGEGEARDSKLHVSECMSLGEIVCSWRVHEPWRDCLFLATAGVGFWQPPWERRHAALL